MSLFGKIAGGIAKVLPVAAAIAPSSKRLTQAVGTLQTVGGVLSGAGFGGLPPPPMPPRGAAMPALPPPGGGGRIVKTGLPVLAVGAAVATRAAPALVAGGRALLAKVSPKVARALGWATVGGLVYDAAGNLQGRVSKRSMNPLNPKAAKRAIRRIKAVRKICTRIESSLPKQRRSCGHQHYVSHRRR